MKAVLNFFRYLVITLLFICFILFFPLATEMRITHAKTFSGEFWSKLIGSADFTKLLTTKISKNELNDILKKPGFIRQKRKLEKYISEEIIDNKFTPFLNKIIGYLTKKRNRLPNPVLVKREKNKVYFYLSSFYNLQSQAIPPQYQRSGNRLLRYIFLRNFPNVINPNSIIMPKIRRNLAQMRNKLSGYDKHSKLLWILPIILALAVALFAFTPRKIFAWLGLCLTISFLFFLAYSIIIFYGLIPSQVLFEQLSITPGLKAFFNDLVINEAMIKEYLKTTILKPIAIEAIIYLILGIVFIIFSLKIKKGINKESHAEAVEINQS